MKKRIHAKNFTCTFGKNQNKNFCLYPFFNNLYYINGYKNNI